MPQKPQKTAIWTHWTRLSHIHVIARAIRPITGNVSNASRPEDFRPQHSRRLLGRRDHHRHGASVNQMVPEATPAALRERAGGLSLRTGRLHRRNGRGDRRERPRGGVGHGGHELGAAGLGGDAVPELSAPRAPTVALQGQEADLARWVAATPAVAPNAPPQLQQKSVVRPVVQCGDLWATRRVVCKRAIRQRAIASALAGGHHGGLARHPKRIWLRIPTWRAWARHRLGHAELEVCKSPAA